MGNGEEERGEGVGKRTHEAQEEEGLAKSVARQVTMTTGVARGICAAHLQSQIRK